MLWLLSAASAADLVPFAGAEVTINDPFVATVGARLGMEVGLTPWLTLGAGGGIHPLSGEWIQSDLTREIIEEHSISPDLSYIRWRALGEARLVPLVVEGDGWTRRLSGHVGLGAVSTRDDAEALQAEDDPLFHATELQIHPMTSFGISGELQRERLGVRVRLERTAYVEDIMSFYEHDRRPSWLGVEMTVRSP